MLFYDHDGKNFVFDIEVDKRVYKAPRQEANAVRLTNGVDFYAHVTVFGKVYFYSVCWSGWPIERLDYRSITDEELLFLDKELNKQDAK